MQLILKKDVQNLGEAGDLVNVKDGYARNFLIPNNMAAPATKGAIADRERNIARIKAKSEKLHNQALETAKKLEEIGTIEFSVKAGESGKLFGTITTKKLAEEILAKSGVEVDRKTIIVDNPINKVGDYTVSIKLTSKIKAQLKVSVSASETIKEAIVEEIEEPQAEETKKEAKKETKKELPQVTEQAAQEEPAAEEVKATEEDAKEEEQPSEEEVE